MSTEQALRSALEIYADSDNWYDEEPFRRSGPVPAWRGPNEDHPEEIARAALALPPSEPSPDVLKAADALADTIGGRLSGSISISDRGIMAYVAAYRTARGHQPEQGELIRGAEKK